MSAKDGFPSTYIITELKTLMTPPQQVKDVAAAVVILLGAFPVSDVTPTDLSEKAYSAFTKAVADPRFAQRLQSFDAKTVTSQQLKAAKDVINNVTSDSIKKSNRAAGELYKWVQKVLQEAGTSSSL